MSLGTQMNRATRTSEVTTSLLKWAVGVVFTLLSGVGCGSEETTVALDPSAVFNSDYASELAQIQDCLMSGSHNEKYVRVYISKSAESAWRSGADDLPEGTVFLKVMHDDSACMKRHVYRARKKGAKGSAPTVGDWQWQQLNATGQLEEKQTAAECASCHNAYKGSDFTATLP